MSAGTILLLTFLQAASADDVRLELRFDISRIRRGDFAYCEVRLHNSGSPPLRCDESIGVSIDCDISGEDLQGRPLRRGGRGRTGRIFGGLTPFIVPPGESRGLIVAQVPLFSAQTLQEIPRPKCATVMASFVHAGRVIRSKTEDLIIEGDAGRDGTIAETLFVPFGLHPEMSDECREHRKSQLLLADLGLPESPWTLNTPSALDSLLEQVEPDSTLHRTVSMARAIRGCVAAPDAVKAEFVGVLVETLGRCRTAERKWFARKALGELLRLGDHTSRRLVLERIAPAMRDLPSSGELTLELMFDRRHVRRGDPSYCEVRLHNRGLESVRLPPLSEIANVFFRVYSSGDATLRTQVGGGACAAGPGSESLAPNEYLSTWAQVPVFSSRSLPQLEGTSQVFVEGAFVFHEVPVESGPVGIKIVGDIGKTKPLAQQFYVPWQQHPPETKEWFDFWKQQPTLIDFGLHLDETPWTWNVAPGFDSLLEQLDPDSAVWRIALITQQARDGLAAVGERSKAAAVERLLVDLNRCGPAERQWLMRKVFFALADKDNVSRRLFVERTINEPGMAGFRYWLEHQTRP